MHLDLINRGLLGVLLLLTLTLLVQRMVLPFDASNRSPSEMASELGRYEFQSQRTPGAPVLMRVDSTNGAIWTRDIEADGEWLRLNEEIAPAGTAVAGVSADDSSTPKKERRRLRRGRRAALDPEAARALRVELAKLKGVELTEKPEDLTTLTNVVRTGVPKELRGWAIRQIAGYPAKDAVPALIPLLDHPDAPVLIGVIRALQAEGDPVAIEPLREVLDHRNPGVKATVKAAIEALEAEAEAEVEAARAEG